MPPSFLPLQYLPITQYYTLKKLIGTPISVSSNVYNNNF